MSVITVMQDFFRYMFTIDFVNNSANPEPTLKRIRILYKIVMDLALLMSERNMAVLTQQFLMLTIRCCVNSLDSEWIPLEGMINGSEG